MSIEKNYKPPEEMSVEDAFSILDTGNPDEIFDDAGFVAEICKGAIVEDLCRAMEEKGLRKINLSELTGWSRQYISQILNGEYNFTIEKLAELSSTLRWQLIVRMIPPYEAMPNVPVEMLSKIREMVRDFSGSNLIKPEWRETSPSPYEAIGGNVIPIEEVYKQGNETEGHDYERSNGSGWIRFGISST